MFFQQRLKLFGDQLLNYTMLFNQSDPVSINTPIFMVYLYLLPSYKHFLTIMLPQINKNEIKNNHHKKLLPTGLGLFCTQTCVRNAVPESDLFGICDCNSISNVNFTVEMNFGCIYFDTDYYTQSANFGTQ